MPAVVVGETGAPAAQAATGHTLILQRLIQELELDLQTVLAPVSKEVSALEVATSPPATAISAVHALCTQQSPHTVEQEARAAQVVWAVGIAKLRPLQPLGLLAQQAVDPAQVQAAQAALEAQAAIGGLQVRRVVRDQPAPTAPLAPALPARQALLED